MFFRMFYGPIVGGLITQHLSFEWAAAVQGGLAALGVSMNFERVTCALWLVLLSSCDHSLRVGTGR